MFRLLTASALALTCAAGLACAQTSEMSTQTTTTTAPGMVAAPPPGTLSTTRETHAVDAYGNRTDSRASAYSNGNGVARDSTTTTTTVPPPPPPPPVSTTTSSSSTTTTTVPN